MALAVSEVALKKKKKKRVYAKCQATEIQWLGNTVATNRAGARKGCLSDSTLAFASGVSKLSCLRKHCLPTQGM